MPYYHKSKQKVLDYIREEMTYRGAIIVSEKDYQRWGTEMDALIKPPFKLVHKYWTKTFIVIGEK